VSREKRWYTFLAVFRLVSWQIAESLIPEGMHGVSYCNPEDKSNSKYIAIPNVNFTTLLPAIRKFKKEMLLRK
jgi:hypothetical protein